jgi:hypothetical protein
MSHNPNVPEEPGQLDLINDQLENFLDCLSDADALQIDGTFVGRNFFITEDIDEDDFGPTILEANYVDDDTLDKYEWAFTLNECEEAKYKSDGVWLVPSLNGSGEVEHEYEIVLYSMTKITP